MSRRLLPRIRVPRALVSLALFALLVAPTAAPAASGADGYGDAGGCGSPGRARSRPARIRRMTLRAASRVAGPSPTSAMRRWCSFLPGSTSSPHGGGGVLDRRRRSRHRHRSLRLPSERPVAWPSARPAAPRPTSAWSIGTRPATTSWSVVYFDVDRTGLHRLGRVLPPQQVPGRHRRAGGPSRILWPATRRSGSGRTPSRTSRRTRRTPTMLVGGSKMYNRDPDSLAEYEFKIGTYASFDRGRSWYDLGQLNTCPQEPGAAVVVAARTTRCYPADDPRAAVPAPRTLTTSRGRTATSARSTSPPTCGRTSTTRATRTRWCSTRRRSASGGGWGMSLHRWETPSPSGHPPRPHVEQPDPHQRVPDRPRRSDSTLDDKNTFAINNAGSRPRRQDGHHGRVLGP